MQVRPASSFWNSEEKKRSYSLLLAMMSGWYYLDSQANSLNKECRMRLLPLSSQPICQRQPQEIPSENNVQSFAKHAFNALAQAVCSRQAIKALTVASITVLTVASLPVASAISGIFSSQFEECAFICDDDKAFWFGPDFVENYACMAVCMMGSRGYSWQPFGG